MTPADILAVAIGCLIGGALTAVMYETGWRWRRRRAKGSRTPKEAEPQSQDTPVLPDDAEGQQASPAYPDHWVPLSRMSREEIKAHMWRMEALTPSVGSPARPCLCGLPHTDPVHVRTVDLTPPASKEER